MKIKVDLHPIYNDTRKIEDALQSAIDEAVRIRATLVEIIPGKGSGALKKTVLRFLDRPDIKAAYHRLEKDSDNWGRLFVHFRPERPTEAGRREQVYQTASYRCFCCSVDNRAQVPDEPPSEWLVECPSCGSPNRLRARVMRSGDVLIDATSGYD